MHCFCMAEAIRNPKGFLDTKFESGIWHCQEWFIQYGTENAVVIGVSLSITVINIITGKVFEYITYLERRNTDVEVTSS